MNTESKKYVVEKEGQYLSKGEMFIGKGFKIVDYMGDYVIDISRAQHLSFDTAQSIAQLLKANVMEVIA